MTDREILDALHNVRTLCIPGVNWTDDISRLTLAEFDRAVVEIKRIIEARDALLEACQEEREDLTSDLSRSRVPRVRKHFGNRIAGLDAAIALAHEGGNTP
jgi:hypothetical protein